MELPGIIGGLLLINRLYRAIAAGSYLDLLMDNTGTSLSEFPTIPLILLPLIPAFRCVSHATIKEFRFQFTRYNEIRLNLIHATNLRLSGSDTYSKPVEILEMQDQDAGG